MIVLDTYSKRAEPLLVQYFKEQRRALSNMPKTAILMLKQIEEFCLRDGKRLRPALVYYSYVALGGKDSDDIVKISLVTELIHAFLLIHDDIMDESVIRRKKPTLHKLYEEEGGKRFGESMAILAGDLSQCLALNLLFETHFSEAQKMAVAQKLNNVIITTIFGQEADIRLENEKAPSVENVLTMYQLKTARYTFESPLHIGALLAGGKKKDLTLLTKYALPLGIAFQIQDDILGLFGKEAEVGKSYGDDIRQGKRTILVAKALELGSSKQKQTLQSLLGKKDITRDDVKKACAVIKNTGSLEYAQELLKKQLTLANNAYHSMQIQGYDKNGLHALSEIADFVIQRSV